MLRLVHLALLPGVLLTTCTTWGVAETTRPGDAVAIENKHIYSSRPAGYTVPVPYYGTPTTPRFLVSPAAQFCPVTETPAVDEPKRTFKADILLHPDPPVVTPQPASVDSAPVPAGVTPGNKTTPSRPALLLQEDAGRNGRRPPPPPPQGEGIDGDIVITTPQEQPLSRAT